MVAVERERGETEGCARVDSHSYFLLNNQQIYTENSSLQHGCQPCTGVLTKDQPALERPPSRRITTYFGISWSRRVSLPIHTYPHSSPPPFPPLRPDENALFYSLASKIF